MDQEFTERAAGRLKELRDSTAMSQKDFAESFGIKPPAYCRYESGDIGKMPRAHIDAISKKYKINHAWLLGFKDVSKYVLVDKAYQETKGLPVFGEIAAGIPIFAQEDILDYVFVPKEFKADFCLKVKGDSMAGARILDGDIVYIRAQESVENGEIAAVVLNSDFATLKRFYRIGENVMLRSENPEHKEIVISPIDKINIKVLGKAILFNSEVK